MERTIDRLPEYLRRHCSEQDYEKYTPANQAAWRYIMRRAAPFFRKNAVAGYEEGFKKTGLSIDRIPRIDEMDRALQRIGWGAVPVCGFIPPWAFLEFQARKILPIATDMRTVAHIGYTPAPDIVHEAAGHAPILPDLKYSDYLSHYAQLCTKAIYSGQDLRLFEAIRRLSDIKENPDSTPDEIAVAEADLEAASKAFTFTSEASRVARMSWWTAEYGLAGSLKDPKIYGAGLLSSVAESKNCLTPAVKKIPFSIDCINYTYDITRQQPQLFVCDTMQDLLDVLVELDGMLSYKKGGVPSLELAKEADAVSTSTLDSGIGVSGKLVNFEHQGDRVDFLKWAGPVQLSFGEKQLSGQGVERHPEGFSSPVGFWRGIDKNPSLLDDSELRDHKLFVGAATTLEFASGFAVSGEITRLVRQNGKLIYVTWKNCTVKKGSQIFFDPAWGEFDMLVGVNIVGVAGGPADRNTYPDSEIEQIETTPGRKIPYSEREKAVFALFSRIRRLREENPANLAASLEDLSDTLAKEYDDQWLAILECYELARERLKLDDQTPWVGKLHKALTAPRVDFDEDTRELIERGLEVIGASAS